MTILRRLFTLFAFQPDAAVTDAPPEPWHVRDLAHDDGDVVHTATFDADGSLLMSDDGEFAKPLPAAVQRRIVACVNACRDIPTEELERRPPFSM